MRNLCRIRDIYFSSCHERGTKNKFGVPARNRTSDLRIPRSDALPLSHRDVGLAFQFAQTVTLLTKNT